MELKSALEQLGLLQKKLYAYQTASSSLYLDSVTVAPKDTSEGRGVALGILAGESQKLITAPETGELLAFLADQKENLSFVEQRQVGELKKSYDRLSRIPADEYMDYAMLTNEASDVWHRAKETSDFTLFAPVLEKLVAYNRKFAGYYDSSKKPYDALLDEYERGADMAFLDTFFETVRERLVPLIHAIGEKPQIDDSFLHLHYPVDIQRKFSDYLMEVMELDRGHCTIGETEHPFTLEFNNKDVRITTNESQSRFYENIIGRSLPFVKAIFPKMQEFFPEQLKHVTAEQMYRAVNKVQPSLIRTEADELTYSLHVMVRYEIEKQLIDGSLEVKDIPEVWNRLYKEYLGVDVPDDRRGCLQDSHWSGGSFGYFPSYALGSAYGAQMLCNMEKDFPVWDEVRAGKLTGVSAWLKEKVHQYGSLLTPGEIVKNACGDFDPTVYTDYLTEKYNKLYDL